MDLYLTTPIGPFPGAAGSAFGSFTSRQDVSASPLPIIQGYQLRIGSKVFIEADGEFSTTATPNLTLGLYIGTAAAAITTVIAESSVITTGSGAAAWPWHMEWRGVVTALGTSGSVTGYGFLDLGTSLTASTRTPIPITQALRTFTWDTTIARAIGVCATYSASSSSNTVKSNPHSVYLLN